MDNPLVKLLLVDSYDSFTFNLQHLFATIAGVTLTVVRNDDDFLADVKKGKFDGIIIGPGPGSPEDPAYFGNNRWMIENYAVHQRPILGICLGFQGIYLYYGGALKVAERPMHGKTSRIHITQKSPILHKIAQSQAVMRYHSIMLDLAKPQPRNIAILARTHADPTNGVNGEEVMAIQHKEFPIYGLQFHPESFATESGMQYAHNFVQITQDAIKKRRHYSG